MFQNSFLSLSDHCFGSCVSDNKKEFWKKWCSSRGGLWGSAFGTVCRAKIQMLSDEEVLPELISEKKSF